VTYLKDIPDSLHNNIRLQTYCWTRHNSQFSMWSVLISC